MARTPIPPLSPTERVAAAGLLDLPNVGPAMARDLLAIGISTRDDLKGQDPDFLFERLCDVTGGRHDPCVRDVFAALVHVADGGEAKPWRAFTAARKARDKKRR
jgi:hypothetical protein